MLSANGIRRHMLSNTSTPRPNVRRDMIHCPKCHFIHFVPPDCPVAPVCPRCLYFEEMETTVKRPASISIGAALVFVLIAVILGYVMGGKH